MQLLSCLWAIRSSCKEEWYYTKNADLLGQHFQLLYRVYYKLILFRSSCGTPFLFNKKEVVLYCT